jgi:hypothetical protein
MEAVVTAEGPGEGNSRTRFVLQAAALVAVTAFFGGVLARRVPVSRWLVWIFAAHWTLSALFALACLVAGHSLLRRGLRLRLPLGEHLVLAFALGVLAFGIGVFLAGLAGLLGGVFFFAYPLALIAAGAAWVSRDLARPLRLLRVVRRRTPRRPTTAFAWLVPAFGLVGVALIYLQILTPANVAYDSRWYHLALADLYAATGEIARFPEGWFSGTLPQMVSWLYTWALLVPGGSLAFRAVLAAHVEFMLFLATLAAVPCLVRWLVGPHRHGWVALLVFPGLYLYDSSLSVAADHVLAFWAIPALLVARRLSSSPTPALAARHRRALQVLLGLLLAGAVLTKYQAMYLLAGTGLVVLAEAVWRGPAPPVARLRQAAGHLAVVGAVMTVATAPHWLKNWFWYGNPVYPLAVSVFGGDPWVHGTADRFVGAGWQPVGGFVSRALQTLAATLTFSFVPHDWTSFHGKVPVFGSLFTLLLLPALFLRRSRRIWLVAVATMLGVLVWFATYHQDRYLQALLPWMAGVVAAVSARVWRLQKTAARVALVCLIGLQLAWGSDVPFFPTHAMIKRTPYEETLKLVTAGHRGADRYELRTPLPEVARALPADALPLYHEQHLRFGWSRPVVVDERGRQGAIDYTALEEPRRVHETMRGLGVTHVVWKPTPRGGQDFSDDLVFHEFVRRHTDLTGTVGGFEIARLRGQSPPAVARATPTGPSVALVACDGVRTVSWRETHRTWRKINRGPCTKIDVAIEQIASVSHEARHLMADQRVGPLLDHLEVGWERLFVRGHVAGYVRRGQ